jgi:hypothetical protein
LNEASACAMNPNKKPTFRKPILLIDWYEKKVYKQNGYNHFRSGLSWFRKFKKRCFKNQMSVIWSWTYFYNLHWNNYLYFKGLFYIWEEMIMWHCYTWPV